MRAASSRIWFPILNSDQPYHTGQVDHSNGSPQADHDQPITNPIKTSSIQSGSINDHGKPFPILVTGSFSTSRLKASLVDGYTRLVTDRIHDGWSFHLLTILFHQLPGPRSAVLDRMKDEVQRVYSTLLTRVHRNPRTASTDVLPILIGVADLPVYKRNRESAPMIYCNNGLHFHALVLMPPTSRLKGSLADHFGSNLDLYAGPGHSVQRVDVRPVVDGHRRVVDYVFKTVLNGRLSYDDAVLILPRARGELRAAQQKAELE
jgi:hypothetical protein